MRESLIERKTCATATANGWLVHPKAAPGTRGWPDRTFSRVSIVGHVKHLELVFVEFKAPGKKPTKLQIHTHEQLRGRGFKVCVIDSVEAGLELFQ